MKRIKIYTIGILMLLGLICFLSCGNSRENYLTQQGNEFVKKVEQYKSINRQLPNSLSDIDIIIKDEANPPIYYEKRDSVNYTISFGTTLGESKIYYSDSKNWEDKYREMK